MKRSGRNPLKPLTVAAALFGAFVSVTLLASPDAEAQVAAKVESQTRPNFGILLDPPVRARPRAPRRWSYGDHRRGGHDYRPDFHRPSFQEEVVLIDCGGNPGSGAVEAAVQRVRPGGTLIIRARAGACVGWLNIDKPMTILGDGGFDPRDWDHHPTPTLQAPDGLPCITVAQGVRVEIRDVVFASPNGGDAACIVGYGAQILMNRVGFRHVGDEAAIYADGGLLDIRNTVIDAQTVGPAIVADGASLTAYEMVVTGAQVGLDLTPGAGLTSTLSAVTLRGSEAPNNFGPRSIGVIVRSSRDYGRVEIANTLICGYVEGVAVEGASVDIQNSRICRADKGVVLYNGEVRLNASRVRASTVGVAAASGRAVVTNNVFAGVRQVVFAEPRASVEQHHNRVWSRYDVCRPSFRSRHRNRYEPYWEQRDYQCEYSAYPRDWWDEEDGTMGFAYADDAYPLDGYDRYQQGDGWYDQDGRYIDGGRRSRGGY